MREKDRSDSLHCNSANFTFAYYLWIVFIRADLILLRPGITKLLATITGQFSLYSIDTKYSLSNTLNLPILLPTTTKSGWEALIEDKIN